MIKKLSFILNHELIEQEVNPNLPLLDYIRKKKHLTGTKEVCKEGDCGACSVLIGELSQGILSYKTITSCIYPIGNCNGKHIVTIEGLNQEELIPQQKVFVNEGASQCGFCTPGFIISLTGYLLSNSKYDYELALKSFDGNICRCTGYLSIKRAVDKLFKQLPSSNNQDHLNFLVKNRIIPEYFLSIKDRLIKLNKNQKEELSKNHFVGGGTDLFVQMPDQMLEKSSTYLAENKLSYIREDESLIKIGSGTTFQQFMQSIIIKNLFPNLSSQFELVASLQIRNSATIGGNIVNASPIGDMSIILIALNARLVISNGSERRTVFLINFYKGYKKTDLSENEFIEEIIFEKPHGSFKFNFEKVSKRKHLDIASVNSAALFIFDEDIINSANISAGGISPIPSYLSDVSKYFSQKKLSEIDYEVIDSIIDRSISPISDVRGSAEYKSLLLKRLIRAHLIELFPSEISIEEVL